MDMIQFDHEIFIPSVRIARLCVIRSSRQPESRVWIVPLLQGQKHANKLSVDPSYADLDEHGKLERENTAQRMDDDYG